MIFIKLSHVVLPDANIGQFVVVEVNVFQHSQDIYISLARLQAVHLITIQCENEMHKLTTNEPITPECKPTEFRRTAKAAWKAE